MKFIIPVESVNQNKGGVVLYDTEKNEILNQYVHDKQWKRSGWRGGCLTLDKCFLIATDWTDLHYFDVRNWKYVTDFKISHFNDLHYLAIKNDNLYVVNTGIDSIEKYSNFFCPSLEKRYIIFDEFDFFRKRHIDLDYKWNEVYKTDRHSCHPNCCAIKGGRLFVTCFEDHTRGHFTGKILDLTNKKVVLNNVNCHDGNFYKGDFYVSQTRQHKILILKDLLDRKLPFENFDEHIEIGKNGWWRGMIIKDDFIFVFNSYRNRKSNLFHARINLKTKKVEFVEVPSVEEMFWDTIYQPCFLES